MEPVSDAEAIPVRVHNRHGDPIDLVPFIVTVGITFMLVLSLGPIYGLSYGLSLGRSVVLSMLVFAGTTVIAYRQLVRRAPPIDAGPLPPGPRVERLLYAAVGFGIVLVALTLPLL